MDILFKYVNRTYLDSSLVEFLALSKNGKNVKEYKV